MKRLALVCALALAPFAFAQLPPMTLPEVSQKASVMQRIGLTDITISYHRPGVNGRKIWGGLVPYNEVWRAGANENTTFTVTSHVTVEGQKLDAGTYGVHMIPTPATWTVIFSKQAHAWGSYSYDPKEDAARVTVTPQPIDNQERLVFTFDDPTDKSVTASLRWEKLRVPVKIDVDTPSVVLAHLREELRRVPRFGWEGWNTAAVYALRNGGNVDEALQWADESIKQQPTFRNLRTKAALLEKKGADAKQVADLRAKALTLATERDLNNYGYSLVGEKKYDDAIGIFNRNLKEHPGSWPAYIGLGDAYAAKGDKKQALENYTKGLPSINDPDETRRVNEEIKRLSS